MCSLTAPSVVLCFVEAMWDVHMPTVKEYKSKKLVEQSFVLDTKKIIHSWHQLSLSVLAKGHTCTSDEFLARPKNNHFSALNKAETIHQNMLIACVF